MTEPQKQPPHGELTPTAVIAAVLVAGIMGASYPYMVLKLGFGPNVSVVAAFFGFLFLKLIDVVLFRKTYNRWQNNLAEAAGTSAALKHDPRTVFRERIMLKNSP